MKQLLKLFGNALFIVIIAVAVITGVFIALCLLGLFDFSLSQLIEVTSWRN